MKVRYISVLLLALLVGCHTERITEEPLVCPCIRFNLVAVSGNPMPYTPTEGFTENHNALLEDYLLFEDDGHVTQTSTVRLVGTHGDTTVKVEKVYGRYQTALPLVTIAWPQAGTLTYTLVNDTLSISIQRKVLSKTVYESWRYVRPR